MEIMSRSTAIAQNLATYYTGKPCHRGHLASRHTRNGSCSRCVSEHRPSRAKPVLILHPHKIIDRDKSRSLGLMHYYTGKPCKHGHYSDRFTVTGICVDCGRIHSASIRKAQPERRSRYQAAANKSIKERSRSDPIFKSKLSMREMVRRVARLIGSKKEKGTIEALGYSPSEFAGHMESLFKGGMSWANHGEWHIDHVIPISIMLKRGITDPATINALKNMQPLWAEDNRRKSARMI